MFDTQLAPAVAALNGVYGKIYDLFDGVNIPEHRNELICFAGIDSYSLSEAQADDSGTASRSVEVRYLIEVLGKRSMTAKALSDRFDNTAIPALESCGADIKDIKRKSCRYSKEHGGYIVSAELVFYTREETAIPPKLLPFSLNGVGYLCFTSYELKREYKTSETPLLGGTIKTRGVGARPIRLTVKGDISSGGGSVYSLLSQNLGASAASLSVGGISLSDMVMTGIELDGRADGSSAIRVDFTEVNDA